MPWVGFKVMPAGYTATNPWSITDNIPIAQQQVVQSSSDQMASTKGLTTGLYTFWQDPNAMTVGDQFVPAAAANFTTVQQCLDLCDDDGTCAGVILEETVDPAAVASTCKLFRGDARNGKFKRTVTRADLDRIVLPIFFLCLGERSGADMTGCSPVSTLAQVWGYFKSRLDWCLLCAAVVCCLEGRHGSECWFEGRHGSSRECVSAWVQEGHTACVWATQVTAYCCLLYAAMAQIVAVSVSNRAWVEGLGGG
jgi:hypothetical protein